MKTPFVRTSRTTTHPERGVTMILVALAMIAIIAMAALSIDVLTLYLAKLEAQRSADAAAVAAAKVIALSGITGDPTNQTSNWGAVCGGSSSSATKVAQAAAQQNSIGGIVATTITVTYAAGNGSSIGPATTDCTTLSQNTAFGVNPIVNVKLTRNALPNFFSRIWGNAGTNINANASAEAFNPSNSGNVGNQTSSGPLTPVQPRCVKPWIVPNLDPRNPDGCTDSTSCSKFVGLSDGSIQHPGISLNGGQSPNNGVIGETFWLIADCRHNGSSCTLRLKNGNSGLQVQPQANYSTTSPFIQLPPNLMYVPGLVGTSVIAIPSCTSGDPYEEAIEGCDQATNYSCGVPNANVADLTQNPATPTSAGVQCLIHQGNQSDLTEPTGQDYFNAFKAPVSYPFQIYAGTSNPLVSGGLPSGTAITTSGSIVSLPIYDNVAANNLQPSVANNVTFVGFLQVFINAADNNGNVNVTVLNVAGCGNGTPAVGPSVTSNSPLPVRLITPP